MLAIVCDGGLVQDVISDEAQLIGREVVIVDYDAESACDDEISAVVQADGSTAEAVLSVQIVEKPSIDLKKLEAEIKTWRSEIDF